MKHAAYDKANLVQLALDMERRFQDAPPGDEHVAVLKFMRDSGALIRSAFPDLCIHGPSCLCQNSRGGVNDAFWAPRWAVVVACMFDVPINLRREWLRRLYDDEATRVTLLVLKAQGLNNRDALADALGVGACRG